MKPVDLIKSQIATAQRISLDYVAEFAGVSPANIEERVRSVLPGAVVGVEQVFAGDPRFQRIRLPGLNPRVLSGASPFDLVEPLREALDALAVEPDLPTDFFPDQAEAGIVESGQMLGCWVNDSMPAPADPVWALTKMRIPEAWAFSEQQGRPARGEGILVAQPDTGITDHAELADAVDPTRWADLLDGGDPVDPLVSNDPMDTPGHGTATGSVVVSRAGGVVTGSAPAAKLVPIRCIESVARITQSRVARAIEHAVDSGCHVVTMSLGGLWSSALAAGVARAIDKNVIVLAAAGNCVRLVVWPARFDRCIAVAGSNFDDDIWRGSCRGRAVDVTAPAQHVYRATARPGMPLTGPGEGTSFAVALTAGVAALWLAHHGREALIAGLAPSERLQDRFSRLLRSTARVPSGWDTGLFGAGVVDALALLEAGSAVPELLAEAPVPAKGTPLNADALEMAREFLADFAGPTEAAVAPEALGKHGLEMVWLALERQRRPARLEETAGTDPVLSAGLREALERPGWGTAAAALGLPSAELLVEDLDLDGHIDPEEPSPEFVPLEAPRTWRVAESLKALRAQVNARAPDRSKASDGSIGDAAHATRKSDHNPWIVDGVVGVVTAIDITHDPAGGCDAGVLAEALRAGRDPRVKYVIWNRRIMSSTKQPWTWRPYAGRNAHTKHVHISVQPDKARYDNVKPWMI
ncbi:S8 family serine peptidase [Sinorhizobium sp. M4_45]|uniref:S8 family peptidase n=1 Tax=Sinorhizobium sp. M4_45 TaxID=2037901 RepID=UPI000C99F2ED|nr:S8 family serine peptidase [Sinorhizobium sp. M4_45]PND27621.1 hypothetical protein CN933_05705 [Sinorhizobium sp. M4_45]